MREDGKGGAVQFDNMQQWSVKGTTPWTQYSITVPLDSRATTVFFGALMAGPGRTWVDDLELLVDGILIAQVPNPAVTGGQRHWDYDLFRLLPDVLRAKNQAERNAVLVEWIDGLGVPASCDPCAAAPVDVHLAADLAWIDDTALLGPKLAGRLQAVHRFRAECDRQFFVSFHPGVGNPDFSAELPYENLALPDSGYRILALFRFWNLVAYWFPYRDLIEERWDDVLVEFLPRLVAANDRDTYQLELMALVARIHDTHANLWSSLDVRPPRGDASVPVVLRFVDKDAVVAGYSQESSGPATSLMLGDVIEQINRQSVRQLVTQWTPWYAASNQDARLRDIAKSLTRGPAGPCSLAIRRGESRLELTAERIAQAKLDPKAGATHDRPGDTCLRLAADVAYLKLSSVKTEDIPQYLAVMDSTRGVVIDIRDYPLSFVVFALGGHFVTELTAFTRFTVGDAANPGAFVWTRAQSIPPLQPHYAGKVVVLVDETTQSSAEYTTMALRAAGAVVIGSTTAGADGNVSTIPLPGGLRTMFSGIGVFYPRPDADAADRHHARYRRQTDAFGDPGRPGRGSGGRAGGGPTRCRPRARRVKITSRARIGVIP
ncbi:MAG: S41 family peptidase [Candidatus Eisenbacteria bacterium]|nr:S41 family peptidase [Candidatus Eisenbacteria bacterium]